jgi:hypothetical protein
MKEFHSGKEFVKGTSRVAANTKELSQADRAL